MSKKAKQILRRPRIPHRISRYFDGQFVNKKFLRIRNKFRALKLLNSDFTLVANNCVSGTVYEDLALPYSTPFVGLYIMPEDFVKLCSSFDSYMAMKLIEYKVADLEFPVARLGDVTIYFMHYPSFALALEKWERRKSRMNPHYIGFILIQRDGCTIVDMKKFDELEHSNKVILTAMKESGCNSAIHISHYGEAHELGNILEFKDSLTGKRIMYDFNFIKWINRFEK